MAGDTDPQALIAALAAIPDQLDDALRRAPARTSGGEGEEGWSESEIMGHLCDSARYWGARMRRVVHEERPTLEIFDQDQLVRLAAYVYRPVDELRREFRLISESTVAFLRQVPPEAWDRAGIHTERGAITLREIVAIEAAHESAHVAQFS